MKAKAIFNWSSGKDSAFALYKILQSNQYEIHSLLTSVNKHYNRISMHGVRTELLKKQAQSLSLPLHIMEIPEIPSMQDYEVIMKQTLEHFKHEGVTHSIFGDIFLEDLRAYRENKLNEIGFKAVFPLWQLDTKRLIHEFIELGFKTIVTCVNEKYLDKSFAGRIIDNDFISDLPSTVDACGENGEFHTFTFDGPIFKQPIFFEKGEVVYKKYEPTKTEDSNSVCNSTLTDTPFTYGFWYCDLV